MSKEITKISFHEAGAKGVGIGYKNFNSDGLKDVTSKECKGIPHIDFTEALQAFKWHLAFLCEFAEQDNFSKFPLDAGYESLRVCGITITGSDEKAGIMITGYKTLKSGKGYSFNTPNMKFNEEGYAFMTELEGAWNKLKEEAGLYLAGKLGIKQTELFEPAAAVGEAAPETI